MGSGIGFLGKFRANTHLFGRNGEKVYRNAQKRTEASRPSNSRFRTRHFWAINRYTLTGFQFSNIRAAGRSGKIE